MPPVFTFSRKPVNEPESEHHGRGQHEYVGDVSHMQVSLRRGAGMGGLVAAQMHQ